MSELGSVGKNVASGAGKSPPPKSTSLPGNKTPDTPNTVKPSPPPVETPKMAEPDTRPVTSSKDMMKAHRSSAAPETNPADTTTPKQPPAGQPAPPATSQPKPPGKYEINQHESENAPRKMAKQPSVAENKAASLAADAVGGAGAAKDLDQATGRNADGSKADMAEKAIGKAKLAGRAANRMFAGGTKAGDFAVDKVGDGLTAGYRGMKKSAGKAKDEVKAVGAALTGKNLMDQFGGGQARSKQAQAASPAQNAAGKNQQQDPNNPQGKNGSKPGTKNGSGNAKGSAKKKGLLGAGATMLVLLMALIMLLGGGISLTVDGQPSEESAKESSSYLPGNNVGDPANVNPGEGGWQDVALYSVAPQKDWSVPKQVPWTIVMGIAAEQTDFGRYSPYDATDRDPDRTSTPIIQRAAGVGTTGANISNVSIQNTGETNRTNPAWRQQIAMKGLVSSGWTPEQAAGLVGNMITESGVEPARAEIGYAFPSTRGWGLIQWTYSRNVSIVAEVKKVLGDKFYTNDPSTLSDEEWMKLMEFQLGYVNHELETSHANVGAELKATKTAAEASYVVLAKFEIPQDIAGNAPIRAAQSEEVLATYKAGGIDAIKNGVLEVNTSRARAEYLTFHMDANGRIHSGNVAETKSFPGTDSCPVDPVAPEIGGQPGQGVGPYLLSAEAAENAAKDGYNPQSPCVGQWVARQLSDSAIEVNGESGFTYHKDAPYNSEEAADKEAFQDNVKFWQEVVARTDIFASNQDYAENCVLPANESASGDAKSAYTQQIAYSFHCQFAKNRDVEVVKSASWKSSADEDASDAQKSRAKMVPDFAKYNDRKVAEQAVINEAFQISYIANKWELDQCNPTAESAQGLIPLTISEAKEAGIAADERCDSAKNAAAAAKLWMEGEKEKIADRSDKEGPFAPAFGGWGKISIALGSDDRADFASFGKASSFAVNEKCRNYVAEWSKDVVKKHIGAGDDEGFSKYAELKDDKKEELLTKGREWSQDTGIFGKKSPWLASACNGGDEKAYAEIIGEVAIDLKDKSNGDDTEKKAWDGFMNWAGLLADRVPSEIQVGKTSLVARLSPVSYSYPTVPTSADAVSLMIMSKTGSQDGFAPMQQRVVEYAIFFGGLSQPFDSAKVLTGSLKEQAETAVGGVSFTGTSSAGWTTPSDGTLGGDGADFGPRNIGAVNGLNTDFHYGVDFIAQCGTPVYAASAGEVVDVTKDNGGGNVIRIKHDGADTLYVHMEEGSNTVKVGDHVEAGQLISKTGTTGYSTGCHLHFEVRPENTPSWADFHKSVDPIPFFRERGIELGVDKHGKIAGAKGASQTEVSPDKCPTKLPDGAQGRVLTGGAETIGIAELCKRSVSQARSPEAAKAIMWAFDKVGKWWYSQPQRNQDGFVDCSSLVSRAYMAADVPLYPAGSNAWVTGTFTTSAGAPQHPMGELKPGDWFEFEPSHVGMVIADGYILESTMPGNQVSIGKMYTGTYNVGGSIDVAYFKK